MLIPLLLSSFEKIEGFIFQVQPIDIPHSVQVCNFWHVLQIVHWTFRLIFLPDILASQDPPSQTMEPLLLRADPLHPFSYPLACPLWALAPSRYLLPIDSGSLYPSSFNLLFNSSEQNISQYDLICPQRVIILSQLDITPIYPGPIMRP